MTSEPCDTITGPDPKLGGATEWKLLGL